MENLDTRVKRLTDENEQLKRENNRLQTQVQTLTLEVNLFIRRSISPMELKSSLESTFETISRGNSFTTWTKISHSQRSCGSGCFQYPRFEVNHRNVSLRSILKMKKTFLSECSSRVFLLKHFLQSIIPLRLLFQVEPFSMRKIQRRVIQLKIMTFLHRRIRNILIYNALLLLTKLIQNGKEMIESMQWMHSSL